LKDFNNAQYHFSLALQQAADENAARKIFDTQNPGPKYAARLYTMADSERKTTVAIQALVLACRLDAPSKERVWLKKAVARLGDDHAADKGIFYVLPPVYGTGDAAAADFLRAVIARNSDRRTRGVSSYLLASLLSNLGDNHEAEAIQLLERCAKEYPDVAL